MTSGLVAMNLAPASMRRIALVSFAALAVVLSAPVRRARRAPIGPALAAQ